MSAYDPKRTFVRPKRCLRHRKDALLQLAVMHRDTETAQIKHDLEILRARYALYERTGRILKALAPVCAALLSVGAVVALIKIFERDVVFGTIFVTVVLVCVWIFWPTFSFDKSRGMNFKNIPELEWPYGYFIALVLMVMVAVLPYLFFKWKKWL
jgi:hypothetical protein